MAMQKMHKESELWKSIKPDLLLRLRDIFVAMYVCRFGRYKDSFNWITNENLDGGVRSKIWHVHMYSWAWSLFVNYMYVKKNCQYTCSAKCILHT